MDLRAAAPESPFRHPTEVRNGGGNVGNGNRVVNEIEDEVVNEIENEIENEMDMSVALSSNRAGMWPKWLGIGFLVLGMSFILGWGIRLAWLGRSLWQDLVALEALLESPETLDPVAACDLLHDTREHLVALNRQAGGLAQVGPSLGWLPVVGGDLAAAPYLLTVGDGLTEAGSLMCDTFGPTLAAFSDDSSREGISPQELVRLLADARPVIEQALAATQLARSAWAQVDVQTLSPRLARKVVLLDQGLPLLEAGLSAAYIAPDLLGMDGPRTYLALAVNEDELRAGGGFISGVGEVHIQSGQLVTMTFRDSYAVDDFTLPYPTPPEPIQRFMGITLWVFRDANWSPDFPSAMETAIPLYRPNPAESRPATIDGVIALDQWALQKLVGAIGPLDLSDAGEPVIGETILSYIREVWNPEDGQTTGGWWSQRKSFMGTVAHAAWERIEGGDVDWVKLAQTMWSLLDEKHIFVYLRHPEAASLLASQGWDGSLCPDPDARDFLMVLDTNMGYNKVNARVAEALTYEVDLHSSPPVATLTLHYTHTGQLVGPCQHAPHYGAVYEDMMNRCYWDYIRVYAAAGSHLLDATHIPVPGDALLTGEDYAGDISIWPAEEGPWVVFGVLGLVLPSSTQTRQFTWTLPADVVQWDGDTGRYVLRVQKQAGTVGHALTVHVRLPEGVELMTTTPAPQAVSANQVIYRTRLRRDRVFALSFKRR